MNKGVLITGAADGIGKEMAKILGAREKVIVLVDVNKDKLQTTAREIRERAPSLVLVTMTMDLSAENSALRLFTDIQSRGIGIHTLINNAGFGTLGMFAENDWEREKRMLRLHIESLTQLCKLFLPEMMENGHGKIMNVASVAGFLPSPLMAVYNASKAYVISFSEALANEVGAHGISVTVLCPGLTRTGFQATVGVGNPEFANNGFLSKGAHEVAAFALRSLDNGKVIAVPGRLNRFTVLIQRFLPRKILVRAVRRVQEKNRNFLSNDQ